MAFNSNDRKQADTYLKNNGYTPLQNSNGYSNGSTVIKPSSSGGSYTANNGTKYTDLSGLKKGTR